MGSALKSVTQKAVQQVVPENLADSELIKQALPGLQDQISAAAKNVNLSDLNPFSGGTSSGTTRISDDDIRNKLGMSPEQYYSLSGAEKAKADDILMPKSFMSKVGDFFTDDPNSGWFDNWRNEQNLKQYDTNPLSPADLKRMDDTNLNQPSADGGYLDAFKAGLKKVATPASLAGIAGGLGSMYLTNQGQKESKAAYDEALADIRNRQDISGDAFNAVSDSPEQLAMRAQALKGLSDRASMGLTPEDQAELQKINRQAAQQFKANQATITQDMARRGMANSGLGLAQSMGAADQALQNQALAGQNQAAQSFAAKQSALNNLAGASNTALQSDFTRQLGKASNLSAVNQFNAQQKATSAANAAQIQQQKAKAAAEAGAAKGQGVQDIVKGAVGILGK
jgi:hypothetical protein